MSKVDKYLERKLTKRDKEELAKIFKIKNELAAQDKSIEVRDYGFRPDGSKAKRTMGEICNKMGLVSGVGEKIFQNTDPHVAPQHSLTSTPFITVSDL